MFLALVLLLLFLPGLCSADGTISGAVHTSTGAPIAGMLVSVYNAAGQRVNSAGTNDSGNFSTVPQSPGTYYLRTVNTSGWVDQLYDGIPCAGECSTTCDPLTGTPVVVADQEVTGIDFVLTRGSSISGTVLDSSGGAPLGVEVEALSMSGQIISSTNAAGGTGHYVLTGLLPGVYGVRTIHSLGYLDEMYDGAPCEPLGCPPSSGTPVFVGENQAVEGIDFQLEAGGVVQGAVTDTQTGALIDAQVYISGNNVPGWTYTTAGRFEFQGLASGEYSLRAERYGYVDDRDLATTVVVEAGATTSTNLTLSPAGSIAGTITETATGNPINPCAVAVYNAAGIKKSRMTTELDGSYLFDAFLAPGVYYLETQNCGPWVDQIYGGAQCTGGVCDPTVGQPVLVQAGATTTANFSLSRGFSISGTIVDGTTGSSSSTVLHVYDSQGRLVAYSPSTVNPHVAGGLLPGTYYALGAVWQNVNLLEELYDGIECPFEHCDILSGTPITITTADVSGIDFVLFPGGRIAGTVRDARTGAGINHMLVIVVDPAGNFVSVGSSDCAGNYQTSATLSTGNYTLRTFDDQDYLNQRYQDAACIFPLSHPELGVKVPVTTGATTGGVDFLLRPVNVLKLVDDFEDDVLAPWTYIKGSWSEASGALIGRSDRTATAISTFAGCSLCSVEAVLQSGDNDGSSVSLLGWYRDGKNQVDLVMKEHEDRWVLKQVAGGSVVASARTRRVIDPGVSYRTRIEFDGATFRVFVDQQQVLTMPSVGNPDGTMGFRVKKTEAHFGEVLVE